MRRLFAVALVGALSISVAACSSDSKGQALKSKPAAATTKTSTSSTTLPFESNAKDVPGTLKGFVGAKADVHDTTCSQKGDGWNAAGKVTNPTKNPVKYRIYVSFLSGDTTVGLVEVNTAKVAPKATEAWDQGVKVTGKDLRCILRVERADA